VTVRDDSSGDDVPPFVFGLARPSVVSVSVSVGGVKQNAMLTDGFYLPKLGSANQGVEAVQNASFVLRGGKTVVPHSDRLTRRVRELAWYRGLGSAGLWVGAVARAAG
jgi:hypothetical protein